PANDELHRRARVAQRSGRTFRFTAGCLERHDGFTAEALDVAAREASIRVGRNLLQIGSDQLKLNRRAATIQDQYVHCSLAPISFIRPRSRSSSTSMSWPS